jgi:hypothetical protein
MKKILIHKNYILLIFTLLVFSSITEATSVLNENLINSNDNQVKFQYVISGNQPPETPDISGPTIGKPGIELDYTIVSTDPEQNDIVYCFDWGDDTGEICIGPYPSGEKVTISHTWIQNGTYTITVKASDILGEESGIATMKVRISTSRSISFSRIFFIRFFKIMSLFNIHF